MAMRGLSLAPRAPAAAAWRPPALAWRSARWRRASASRRRRGAARRCPEERQRGLLLPEERHPGLLGRGGQVRRAGRRLREEGCPGGRRVHGGGGGADGLQRGPQDRAAV